MRSIRYLNQPIIKWIDRSKPDIRINKGVLWQLETALGHLPDSAEATRFGNKTWVKQDFPMLN